MRVMWKFPLPKTGDNIVEMPKGAIVRALVIQNTTIMLYAECNNKAGYPGEERLFEVIATGKPLAADGEFYFAQYVGTVPWHGGSEVWHVYEWVNRDPEVNRVA